MQCFCGGECSKPTCRGTWDFSSRRTVNVSALFWPWSMWLTRCYLCSVLYCYSVCFWRVGHSYLDVAYFVRCFILSLILLRWGSVTTPNTPNRVLWLNTFFKAVSVAATLFDCVYIVGQDLSLELVDSRQSSFFQMLALWQRASVRRSFRCVVPLLRKYVCLLVLCVQYNPCCSSVCTKLYVLHIALRSLWPSLPRAGVCLLHHKRSAHPQVCVRVQTCMSRISLPL